MASLLPTSPRRDDQNRRLAVLRPRPDVRHEPRVVGAIHTLSGAFAAGHPPLRIARERQKSAQSGHQSTPQQTFATVAVTREALDAARYIIDMTAQLEAAAITAHLGRLAYFLGMAKLESEIFVRTYFALEAERAEEKSDERAAGLHQENSSFDSTTEPLPVRLTIRR